MLHFDVWRALGPTIGFAAAGLVIGLILALLVLPSTRRRRTWWGDLINAVLRGPIVLWCVAGALYLATEILTIQPRFAMGMRRTLFVLVVLSISWSVARLVGAIIAHLARPLSGTLASATLLVNVVRLLVLSFGVLIVLQYFGVSVAPLLTALGIGGLAIGLALQDTLANFFAGIHILSSRQVRPGDYVQLATGEEGYIQDVTWRYTTIRQLTNNLTIVPNARLATTILTNFYLPVMETTVLVPVTVANDSDLGRVEQISVDVARTIMQEVAGGIAEYEPFVRFGSFAKPGIAFTIAMRGREVVDQHLIRHEFIKRLQQRYKKEGITIL
jgi:small-conductance mechanosensitive channel